MIFPVELNYETIEFHIEMTKKNKAAKNPKNKEFRKERTQQRRSKKANKKQPLTKTTNLDLPNHP